MHCLSIYAMQQIYNGNWEGTNSYKNLKIPIGKVLVALEEPENTQWLDEAIIGHHSTKTYMSSSEIKSQLTLVSNESLFNTVAKKMYYIQDSNKNPEVKLKKLLNDAFNRRNKIVHKADRDHSSGIRFDISYEEVNRYILGIKFFIDTLHSKLQDR